MTNSHKPSAVPAVFGLLLGGAALLSSCAKDELTVPETAVATTKAEDYTGEELYRGIFFFEGEVAAKIPAFDSYRATIRKTEAQHPEMTAVRQRNIDAMVQAARSLDPTYFAKLKQAIQSQDFQQIRQVIKQGSTLNEAITLNSLTSPTQKQVYQRRKQVLQKLDMSRYDFQQEQDIQRYIQDAQQALTAAGEEVLPQQIQSELSFAFVYHSGDYVAYQSVSVFMAEHAHAFFEKLTEKDADSQLEVDMLIKQLALNLQ
ncbi:hypothetical protein [Hymenobacter metallicola]|uniref:Lipoprotein n=1 Tax=Hymenobacter metallicola TaxID=2563114 RepID=A0A4Z0QJB4_9BACT|nr:hypothetical protein [Hymenobacter metallicola]TGE29606.1 hypothetical protein E5K02_09180 [Hymenobacter metallicola]